MKFKVKIAICDDEPFFRKELIKQLRDSFHKLKGEPSYTIDEFDDMEEIKKEVQKGTQYHLTFLDIEMGAGKMGGIEFAKFLLQYAPRTLVVFISSHPECVTEVFEVKAYQFMLKPLKPIQFDHILKLCLQELRHRNYRYKVKTGKETIYINLPDLMYIESSLHNLILHLRKVDIGIRGILDKEADKLQSWGFVRIHQSYLINMEHISSMSRQGVCLDNGISLPISRAFSRESKEIYDNYILEWCI